MVTLPVFPFFLRKRACPAYFGAFFSSGKLPVYYTLLLVVCQGFIGVKNVKARKNPLKREKARKKTVAFFFKVCYNAVNARRWRSSGSLHRQSAIAGPNAFPGKRHGRYARRKGC